MPTLFDPIRLGAVEAPNRILMAPLTRGRATADHVPTPLMAEYYAQRAGAGLIISEATGVSLQGLGWPYAPGIWNEAQVEGWRRVTDAVHRRGGHIIAQLWHMGRLVHPAMPGRGTPVSASATTAPDHAHTYEGKKPYVQARALRIDEIPALIGEFRQAARNAMAAGFDGVQLHAANGYLIDQFLRASANLRTDAYGGSVQNRMRLLMEITHALVETVGAERTAIRISPNGDVQGVNDPDPEPLFTEVARALSPLGLMFLEVREPPPDGTFGRPDRPPLTPAIRAAYRGVLVANSDYDGPRAEAALRSGLADAIAFGRPFLANPDLPARLRAHAPLNPVDARTFYTQGPAGYADYPVLESAA